MDNCNPIPFYMDNIEDFEFEKETYKIKLKPTAKKESIQAFIRFSIHSFEYGDIVYSPSKLSQLMIAKFKELEIYQFKTAEERQEIIQYLIDNPDIDIKDPDIV